MSQRLRRMNKGFTLIELLVVIAIIGVLAAILTVALNTTKKVALQTQCVNNLKQLGTALSLYLDPASSDGYLPKVTGTNSSGQTKDWADALRRPRGLGEWNDDVRVKDEADWGSAVRGKYKVFDCPANRRPASAATGKRFDYTYNIKLADKNGTGPWMSDQCGDVVFLHDHVDIAVDEGNNCLGIHGGQDNFLFLDGSVKQSEVDGYAMKSADETPWNPDPTAD